MKLFMASAKQVRSRRNCFRSAVRTRKHVVEVLQGHGRHEIGPGMLLEYLHEPQGLSGGAEGLTLLHGAVVEVDVQPGKVGG